MAQFNIYQAVTDRIIEQLEQGVIPWRKPWKVSGIQIRFKEDLTKLAFNRVAYPKTLCKTYGIPHPTYAAFYRCVPEFNPTTEECSFDNLEDLIKWCQEN